jgi:adenylate cyclase
MTAALPQRSVDLAEVRPCLEGAIPAIMATCAADGTPNVAYISQVYYVDEGHVSLSFQFFNKTRQNLLANPRSTLLVLNPLNAVFYRLHLLYLRTEESGPVFESMKAQLAGIASHTGMADVFRLRGSDIHEVIEVERLPQEPLPEALPAPPPRPNHLAVMRRGSARLSAARSLGEALDATLDTLVQDLAVRHAMVLILDTTTQRLYTVASRGYETSGVGSEIALGDGVIGVAARECTPVRIMHMTSAYLYSRAMRNSLGDACPQNTDIPYPGLPEPHSQLAVPLRSAGRVVGVLFVESPLDMQFSFEDEDLLVALGGQLGAAIDLMHEAEAPCTEVAPDVAVASVPAVPPGPALHVRHYRSNDSVFINNAYLIKGVAGAILWKLLRDGQHGRNDFTNRELRLDASLRLPDVADNLEARLLLLHRRLAEQCPQLRIQKTGRGCFRFEANGPVELEDVAA